MATDPLAAFSDHYRVARPIFHALITASTAAEADAAVPDGIEWIRVLQEEMAPPMGNDVVAVLEYIHDPKPHEQRRFTARLDSAAAASSVRSSTATEIPIALGYFSKEHESTTLVMDVLLVRMLDIIESGKRAKTESGRKPIDDDALIADGCRRTQAQLQATRKHETHARNTKLQEAADEIWNEGLTKSERLTKEQVADQLLKRSDAAELCRNQRSRSKIILSKDSLMRLISEPSGLPPVSRRKDIR